MNEYIFYTSEGICESPIFEIVENFQILGFELGKDKEEALSNLLKNNLWITENGYSVEKMMVKKIQKD